MANTFAIPAYGAPLRIPEYYRDLDAILAVLRPFASLRTCANHLNNSDIRTPSGLRWSKQAVANYLRNRKLSTTNINEPE